MLAVQKDQHLQWFEKLKRSSGMGSHHRRDFKINHGGSLNPHHLFMIDAVYAVDSTEEANPDVEETEAREDEEVDATVTEQRPKKGRVNYYDRQQQLELVLAAQELSGIDNRADRAEMEEEGDEIRSFDIWLDANCLALLREGVLPELIELEEGRKARKIIEHYCWREQKLFFKGLYVPRPEERRSLVVKMHEDLGHSGEQKVLTEICRRYFWHHRTEDVKSVVRSCQLCQLVKSEGSVRSGDQELKSIPVCDLFYRVAMDTAGPLPETKTGNKYILVAIDHYSKWCEAKAVADHSAKTAARFLEDELICRYGVPSFIFTNNGGEWGAEFEAMCKDYAIQHQHTSPQWPQCNGMAERMIKTIKYGITVLATNPASIDCWDEHLAKMLFLHQYTYQYYIHKLFFISQYNININILRNNLCTCLYCACFLV